MRKLKKALALILTLAMALSMANVASAVESTVTGLDEIGAVVIDVAEGGEITDEYAKGITIKSEYEGFNPIIIHDSEYVIEDSTIIIDSEGDGSVTNDFSGYGAAIAAYGDDTVLWIKNTTVDVSGVANLTVFADDGSDVIIENSKMHSDGGTLYEDYKNSPDQTTMVAPPWILGIMGTSRCTNLMGTNSSTTVIESDMTAAQWAILSTDSGSNMTLNVVNSYMGLTGADYDLQEGEWFGTAAGKDSNPYTTRAGYGTYTIGNANEKFWGVDMEVGTYANIYTGGTGLYTAMKAGETIELLNANGDVVTTYTPSETKVTTINSDTFGFMIHQGNNNLTIEEGTVVNSGYTTFLQKTGCTMNALVSNSVLNPGNGIILQVMDNDDATTGMDMASFSFYTTHEEYPGWPTVGTTNANSESSYTFENVTLNGDLFNGSGWELNSSGAQTASPVVVNLTGNTTLTGQVSSTAAIHVTKAGSDAVKAAPAGQKASEDWLQYQNTSFTMSEYYDIGQVANKVASNGFNTIDVVVADNASWNVTGDGIVNNVTAASSAIVADKAVTLTVEGTLTLDGTVITEDTTIGNVAYKLASVDVEDTGIDVSGWAVGDLKTGYPDISGATTVEGAFKADGTTPEAVKIVDGDGDGVASVGDAVLQYEVSTMLGWLDADLKLTTTYPLSTGEGGGEGSGEGGPGMGGEGGPGMGGEGGPGMGGGSSESGAWYTEDDTLILAVKDGVVVAPGTDGATEYTVARLMYGSDDNLSSFSRGGHVIGGDDDYAFMTALYVNGGEASYTTESNDQPTAPAYVTKGSYGRDYSAAPRWASVENASGVVEINDDVSWHNGVVFDIPGTYALSGQILMNTLADGSDTNDFSGLGAAIMVNGCDPEDNPAGEAVIAYINDAKVATYGVAKLALFTDGGAVSIVKNSEFYAYGGTIYADYMSTADQSVMVSPPWVLGLGGNAEEPCNARTTNLMGDYSVAAYVDSYFYAKGWGALSVDSGTNMNMVVVNSKVDVETSGYGAYNIGNSTETYYGSEMDVSTYGIIMTGGEATFKSYTGGTKIPVVQFSGETNDYGHGINGKEITTVVSDKVAEGAVKTSKVVSDNFGFMCHNNGKSGWNVVNILDGTEVESTDAIFLVKKVNAEINVDEAKLSSTEKGVILQIIDNDDDYVGLDFAAEWGEDNEYGHTAGSHMPTFNSKFHEDAGYANEWIAEGSAAGQADYDVTGNWVVEYNMTNTAAAGDLWNSTGYVGTNPATTMNVNLGKGASLTGIISAGAFSHDIKDVTVGNGDWTGAAALGHVTNIVNSNGVNLVNVTLTDDAAWTVTGNGIVNNLTASSKAIVADKAVTITVEGVLTLDGKVITKDTTIGNVTYDVNDAPVSGGETTTPSTDSTSPKTGDTAMPVIVASIAFLAVAAFVVLFVQKKKA